MTQVDMAAAQQSCFTVKEAMLHMHWEPLHSDGISTTHSPSAELCKGQEMAHTWCTEEGA